MLLKLLSIVHEICNAISLRHSPAASQQQSKPYLWQRRRSASASHSAFVCVCKFVCIAPFISNCTHYKFNPFQQRMAVHSQSSSNTALQKAWWFMPQIGLTIPHQPPLRPTLPQYGTSYLSLHLFSSRFCFRCFFSISFRLNWFSFIVSSSTSLLLTSLPRFSCLFAALSKTIFNAWSKHCSACYAFLWPASLRQHPLPTMNLIPLERSAHATPPSRVSNENAAGVHVKYLHNFGCLRALSSIWICCD